MQAIDNLIITGSNGFVGESLLSFISRQDLDKQPRKIITFNRSDKSKEILSKYPNLNIDYRLANLMQPWTFDIPNDPNGHSWVKLNNKFYDAEVPKGVSKLEEIPYIQRAITKLKSSEWLDDSFYKNIQQ